jgi:hypothetical protein
MLPQVMLRRGGSCFRVEHSLLCGIPNLETIKQKQVNSASKPQDFQNPYKTWETLTTLALL